MNTSQVLFPRNLLSKFPYWGLTDYCDIPTACRQRIKASSMHRYAVSNDKLGGETVADKSQKPCQTSRWTRIWSLPGH